jgi:hypothetical protein
MMDLEIYTDTVWKGGAADALDCGPDENWRWTGRLMVSAGAGRQ